MEHLGTFRFAVRFVLGTITSNFSFHLPRATFSHRFQALLLVLFFYTEKQNTQPTPTKGKRNTTTHRLLRRPPLTLFCLAGTPQPHSLRLDRQSSKRSLFTAYFSFQSKYTSVIAFTWNFHCRDCGIFFLVGRHPFGVLRKQRNHYPRL